MNSYKTKRFNRLLRVRAKNIKARKNGLIAYCVIFGLYLLIDILHIALAGGDPEGQMGFIFTIVKAFMLVVLSVTICGMLFGSDRKNNQVNVELRSGYDRPDIYWSRVVEVLVMIGVTVVIIAIINGIAYGAEWGTFVTWIKHPVDPNAKPNGNSGIGPDGKGYDPNNNPYWDPHWNQNALDGWSDKEVKGLINLGLNVTSAFLIVDIWVALVTMIITSAITIGLTFKLNTGGSITLGFIFGLIIIIVILLASVGTFDVLINLENHGNKHYGMFPWIVPGFGHNVPDRIPGRKIDYSFWG